MKKLLLFLVIFTATIGLYAQKEVAVFYSSDDAQSIVTAAITKVKYPGAGVYDIADLDSTSTKKAITDLTDSSYHRVIVAVDTTKTEDSTFVAGQIIGSWYYYIDSIILYQANDSLNGLPVDSLPFYNETSNTQSRAEALWNNADVFGDKTEPLILTYLGTKYFSTATGNPTAVTDTTLIDTSIDLDSAGYVGDYVYITSGTGIGEIQEITYNDEDTLYVESWGTKPTTGSTYVVRKALKSGNNFYDIYTELYVLTYMNDLTTNADLRKWYKVLDHGHNLNTSNNLSPFQDVDYLWNTIIAGGKIIFDYLKL